MKQAAKKRAERPVDEILTGLFSKKEAGSRIADGCRHLHSSPMGAREPGAVLTREAIVAGKIPTYQWELVKGSQGALVHSSTDRHAVIRQVAIESGAEAKRDLREKLASVLEELVSNAIYHAYMAPAGESKYPRQKPAQLAEDERIEVRFRATPTGIFLSVTDQGGALSFPKVAGSFRRCYGATERQIEDKESGAGLGLYMVFEVATHIKILRYPGRKTEISCWIAEKRAFDPDYFSFNFFEWR